MVKLDFGELLEPSWDNFGSLQGSLGALLGPSWGSLGALLGASRALPGPLWRPSIKKRMGRNVNAPSEAEQTPLGNLLGRS